MDFGKLREALKKVPRECLRLEPEEIIAELKLCGVEQELRAARDRIILGEVQIYRKHFK